MKNLNPIEDFAASLCNGSPNYEDIEDALLIKVTEVEHQLAHCHGLQKSGFNETSDFISSLYLYLQAIMWARENL